MIRSLRVLASSLKDFEKPDRDVADDAVEKLIQNLGIAITAAGPWLKMSHTSGWDVIPHETYNCPKHVSAILDVAYISHSIYSTNRAIDRYLCPVPSKDPLAYPNKLRISAITP